jgi:hypothetical protein
MKKLILLFGCLLICIGKIYLRPNGTFDISIPVGKLAAGMYLVNIYNALQPADGRTLKLIKIN